VVITVLDCFLLENMKVKDSSWMD